MLDITPMHTHLLTRRQNRRTRASGWLEGYSGLESDLPRLLRQTQHTQDVVLRHPVRVFPSSSRSHCEETIGLGELTGGNRKNGRLGKLGVMET